MSLLRIIRAAAVVLAVSFPAIAQEKPAPPVEEFVKATYYHGVPFEQAARYGPQDAAPLISLLKDEGARASWANAVWVLGIIATEEAEAGLIDFLENRFDGVVEQPALNALLLASQALGFRARDPETKAFQYLVDGTEPATWKRRDLGWTSKTWDAATKATLMAKLSVNGVGIAGNEAGRAHLERLARRLPQEDPELWRVLKPNVEEAVALSRQIEENGYLRVFSSAGRSPRP